MVGTPDRLGWRGHGRQTAVVARAWQARARATCVEVSWPRVPPHHLWRGVHGTRAPRSSALAWTRDEALTRHSRIRARARSIASLRREGTTVPRARVCLRCARVGERTGGSPAVIGQELA